MVLLIMVLLIMVLLIMVLLIQVELLWGERGALGNDACPILSVEVDALDRTVVQFGITHVGPVDVTCIGIHYHAIRSAAIRDQDSLAGTVGVSGEDAAAAGIENE
jgi:hypothetical protein